MRSHETKVSENPSKAAARQPFGEHCVSLFAPHHKFIIQPKLTINQPNDIYEQEADKIADQVMRMESPFIQTKPLTVSSLQRLCAECEEEEKMQRKEFNGDERTADKDLENYVGNLSNRGQSLSDDVRNFYEPRFGYDFSNVKVHNDFVAGKSAQSINALAYTSGNNIVFNQGQYSPGTESGKRLLAHELTHVVQQGGYFSSAGPIMKKGVDGQSCESAPPSEDEREDELMDIQKEPIEKQVMRKAAVETCPGGITASIQRFTLENFPAAEDAQMQTAIPTAASTIASCKGLGKTVVPKIRDATYIFVPDLNDCGMTYPAPWADIRIGQKAFNPDRCCTLASTIAHEASHTQFYTEGAARKLECDCFSCSC